LEDTDKSPVRVKRRTRSKSKSKKSKNSNTKNRTSFKSPTSAKIKYRKNNSNIIDEESE